jgi:hypothetical protein
MSGKHHREYMAAYMRGYRRRKSAELAAYRAAHRERNRDAMRTYERDRARRRRRERAAVVAIPPGQSRALDMLRAQLKAARGPERERIEAALVHLELVLSGEKVRPRDPRRIELRPLRPTPFNVRFTATAAATDDDGAPKLTSKTVGSWMDAKLPPRD